MQQWPLLVFTIVMAIAITASAAYALRQHWRRMAHGASADHFDRTHRRIGWLLAHPIVRLVPALVHAIGRPAMWAPHWLDQLFSLWDAWTLYQFLQLLLRGYFYRAAAVHYASPFPIYHRDKCVAGHRAYVEARLDAMLHHHIDVIRRGSQWPPQCTHWLADSVHYSCVFVALWQCLVAILMTLAVALAPTEADTTTMLRLASLVPVVVVLCPQLYALANLISMGDVVAGGALRLNAKLSCLFTSLLGVTLVGALVHNQVLRLTTLLLALWCQSLAHHWLYRADELTRCAAIDMRYASNFDVA